MNKVKINNQKEMADLAKEIAAKSNVGDVIALKGTLGAGKTFFAKNFINALQENSGEILSPTFNIVYSYNTKKGEVFHFDLYRLKNADELENIGFFDALKNGICLIEWAEIAHKFLPKNYLEIEIKILGDEEREVIFRKLHTGVSA
ncbi:MAG: tRNA (adenosine(37)-N6)-threonylcarbamoyltransferase complex ATPase subunit type 1 TsaE [Rickettsiales bacterium]|nr:tRNA (adenosine(37)-N6)-threonylcarbamoyltransferase complex ATPase subunit type 1 TsaE [Rickettsiales bacterium]